MTKVIHLITGLDKGGAETNLYQILKNKKDGSLDYSVVSLSDGGFYKDKISELGVPVVCFDFKRRPLSSFNGVKKIVKGSDVLFCWMSHANLIGYYSARGKRVKKLIWGIRHSNLDKCLEKKSNIAVTKLCARLSKKVDVRAFNGNRSKEAYEDAGFKGKSNIVIENGVDTDEFSPDHRDRPALCKMAGIPEDSTIVLSVARYHPIKGIPYFLKAFSELRRTTPRAVALLCGGGIDPENVELTGMCEELGLEPGKDVILMGQRNDLPFIMASSDLYVLHSVSEAFPNTLAQAMASGCLCVSTDAGDAAAILNSPDLIAAPRDPEGLLEKIGSALALPEEEKERRKALNRTRIVTAYNIKTVVCKYEGLCK
ncbi:MAG: glycosyltransferase [Clostridia bacterium]|nr:glycosyltransferase [Clostridia bacterium]